MMTAALEPPSLYRENTRIRPTDSARDTGLWLLKRPRQLFTPLVELLLARRTACEPREIVKVKTVGAGIAIGVAIGVGIGAAMGNLGAGIAIGIAIGAAVGASRQKKDD